MRTSFINLFIYILFVGICQSHLQANTEVRERFDEVIDHVEANPINELPIGTHPERANVVFCRLFNISVSARAYFQLHTDPSLDASSSELLKKAAQWYLDNPGKIPDPDATYWAGEYHSAALAKFGSRGTERKGAIPRETERIVLEYMMSYLNYWSRLEHYEASLKYDTYYYWSTENHWWQEIVTAWGYLLALKDDPDFKDRILDDGKSLQEHYERTAHYMKAHMQQRAKKGFLIEISSGGYSSRMHNMWYLIYDISPDKELRKLAKSTLDLYWAFWAEEHIAGERGGGKVRHRRFRGLGPNTGRHLIPAWLYFGVGTLGLDHIKAISPDTADLAMHYMVLFSGYFPDEVIYKILEDRKDAPPYSITQRRLGKQIPADKVPEIAEMKGGLYDVEEGDCLKYSWVTPDFILGTVMRPPHDGYIWNRGAAQGWWHGLIIAGKGPHDPPERVVPTFILDRDISSDQYAVQSKGSFMARKIPDKVWGKNNAIIPMGIFISEGLEKRTEFNDDFLFIKDPKCWVAVRAVDTRFVTANQILSVLPKKHMRVGDFYKLENDHQPVIIEVAVPGSYKNFKAFKAAAEKAKLVSADGEHSYHSLSGDKLTMYDDRSTPEINDKEIEYNPEMAYDSRYIQSEWDSGIVKISAMGTETVLDFALSSNDKDFGESVSVEELDSEWNFNGIGIKKAERGMLYMKESPGSLGVMLVSPEAYDADVTVRYEVMPMTAASVCVAIVSASDPGDALTLSLPDEYDGSMGHWINSVENYFFAFHNAAHNRFPFAIRFPEKALIGEYHENLMTNGKFHEVEVGNKEGEIRLKIDGQVIVEGTDEDPLGSGFIAFRIRGLSEEPAACLIRNVIIENPVK